MEPFVPIFVPHLFCPICELLPIDLRCVGGKELTCVDSVDIVAIPFYPVKDVFHVELSIGVNIPMPFVLEAPVGLPSFLFKCQRLILE